MLLENRSSSSSSSSNSSSSNGSSKMAACLESVRWRCSCHSHMALSGNIDERRGRVGILSSHVLPAYKTPHERRVCMDGTLWAPPRLSLA